MGDDSWREFSPSLQLDIHCVMRALMKMKEMTLMKAVIWLFSNYVEGGRPKEFHLRLQSYKVCMVL